MLVSFWSVIPVTNSTDPREILVITGDMWSVEIRSL
jgi:hypothetical protein